MSEGAPWRIEVEGDPGAWSPVHGAHGTYEDVRALWDSAIAHRAQLAPRDPPRLRLVGPEGDVVSNTTRGLGRAEAQALLTWAIERGDAPPRCGDADAARAAWRALYELAGYRTDPSPLATEARLHALAACGVLKGECTFCKACQRPGDVYWVAAALIPPGELEATAAEHGLPLAVAREAWRRVEQRRAEHASGRTNG